MRDIAVFVGRGISYTNADHSSTKWDTWSTYQRHSGSHLQHGGRWRTFALSLLSLNKPLELVFVSKMASQMCVEYVIYLDTFDSVSADSDIQPNVFKLLSAYQANLSYYCERQKGTDYRCNVLPFKQIIWKIIKVVAVLVDAGSDYRASVCVV